jgi:hypothetical protein
MKLSNHTEVLLDGPRTAPYAIRFPLEAKRRIEEAARHEGRTMANYLLIAALERAGQQERMK